MKSTPIKERRTRAFIKATEWLNNSTGKGYTGIYTEAGMDRNHFNSMRLRNSKVEDADIEQIDSVFPGFKDVFNSMLNGTWKETQVSDIHMLEEARMGYERAAKKIEEANAEANKALWLTVNSKEAVIAMMQAEIDRLKAELENINKKSE